MNRRFGLSTEDTQRPITPGSGPAGPVQKHGVPSGAGYGMMQVVVRVTHLLDVSVCDKRIQRVGSAVQVLAGGFAAHSHLVAGPPKLGDAA